MKNMEDGKAAVGETVPFWVRWRGLFMQLVLGPRSIGNVG